MSNLLEFQQRLADDKIATYNLETSELNPKGFDGRNADEVFESREIFERSLYTLGTLRQYILNNAEVLASTGNVIQGKIEGRVVMLTVIEIN